MKPVLAIFVGLLGAGSARADVGPGLPFAKNATAIHRIEVAETFPDHVFIVHRHGYATDANGWQEYNTATRENLAPGRPIELRPELHEDVLLMIVPRAGAAAYATPADVASAVFQEMIPGATAHRFSDREMVPSWADDETTIIYRVQHAKSGDGLELTRTSRSPYWQWNAAAIGLAAAIVLGGFWLIRRLHRRRVSV